MNEYWEARLAEVRRINRRIEEELLTELARRRSVLEARLATTAGEPSPRRIDVRSWSVNRPLRREEVA